MSKEITIEDIEKVIEYAESLPKKEIGLDCGCKIITQGIRTVGFQSCPEHIARVKELFDFPTESSGILDGRMATYKGIPIYVSTLK